VVCVETRLPNDAAEKRRRIRAPEGRLTIARRF
jgi:hypothetical protein